MVLVGEGSHRPGIAQAVEEAGVGDRVRFAGQVDDDQLVALYRGALAVVYVPFDEDYGLVTLEAYAAAKPVVTTRDGGGTLEFVIDGVTGLVAEPDPAGVGAALSALASDRAFARRLGEAGLESVRDITWDAVVERLVSHA
jgi:glycosyltransferase involved in cell wall biosynthesis